MISNSKNTLLGWMHYLSPPSSPKAKHTVLSLDLLGHDFKYIVCNYINIIMGPLRPTPSHGARREWTSINAFIVIFAGKTLPSQSPVK